MSDIDLACEAIRTAKGVVLTTHTSPDGDGIGSQIGLYHALRDAGIKVFMHNRDGVPRIYRFLSETDAVTTGETFPHQDEVDLIISLDCGSRGRLGMPETFFEGARLLNVDHHVSNKRYGDINMIEPAACATGSMVLDVIRHMGLPLSKPSADGIYVAILTDTGSFHHPNTTPEVHRMTGDLIQAGAEPWPIAMSVYESGTKARLALLCACLGTLETHDRDRSAWLYIDHGMYEESGAIEEDTEGFIDYGRGLEGVEVAVLLRQEGKGDRWKATFRSKVSADVGGLAATLGGGGHRHAAGCILTGSLQEVRERVRKAVSELFA
jgi:phosphoesterase RecJ-like protein